MAYLIVREPGRVAFTIELGDACSIGRDATNDIVLADVHVSRVHARIIADAGGHKAQDLDSRHGTFVNGVRVAAQALHDGDQLQFGESRAHVSRSGPARQAGDREHRGRNAPAGDRQRGGGAIATPP